MVVLNTFVKVDTNGWVGIAVLFLLLAVVVFMLKDDITRFFEHHTIGAGFYKYMKYMWIIPFVVSIIFTVMSMRSSIEHRVIVEATIKDEYPIGALYERYEIIEKRGDIWVLEQRPTWQEGVDSSSTGKEVK